MFHLDLNEKQNDRQTWDILMEFLAIRVSEKIAKIK